MRDRVIECLNTARAHDLRAILQFMNHSYELTEQGYGGLAASFRTIAIQEMQHAQALAQRVLFLGGEPVSEPSADTDKTKDFETMLTADIAQESRAIACLQEASAVCSSAGDRVSLGIFEQLLADSEGHLDTFQKMKDHLVKLGPAYLAAQTTGPATA